MLDSKYEKSVMLITPTELNNILKFPYRQNEYIAFELPNRPTGLLKDFI